MEKKIYEGDYRLVPSLESALLVDRYQIPGMTAEGVDVIVRHLSGVTVKQERYEDDSRIVSPGAPLTAQDLRYTGLMKITLYAQDENALGDIEKMILGEIERE